MFNQDGCSRLRQRIVTEFAVLGAAAALPARVEELAGEIFVQVETLLLLGAAIHQVELAEFHLTRRKRCVRVRAIRTAAALAFHVESAQRFLLIKFKIHPISYIYDCINLDVTVVYFTLTLAAMDVGADVDDLVDPLRSLRSLRSRSPRLPRSGRSRLLPRFRRRGGLARVGRVRFRRTATPESS